MGRYIRSAAAAVILVAAAVRSDAAAAEKQVGSGAPPVRACQSELQRRVHAQHPAAGSVTLHGDTLRERPAANGRVEIRGAGEVETRDSGRRRLTFTCVADENGRSVASLRFDIASASATQSQTPTYVCKRAVSKRIHDDHPAAGKIRWRVGSDRETDHGGGQTGVTGAGRIQTRDGTWRTFTFTCTYDRRSGRATRAAAKF